MAAPHIEHIKALDKSIWPAISASIRAWIVNRGGRRPSSFNRRIVEQTLFELHRGGNLMTPEHADLIEKAKAWHEAWGKDPISMEDEDVTEEDVLLYHAIGQLP